MGARGVFPSWHRRRSNHPAGRGRVSLLMAVRKRPLLYVQQRSYRAAALVPRMLTCEHR